MLLRQVCIVFAMEELKAKLKQAIALGLEG